MERTSWTTGNVPGEIRLVFGRAGEGAEPVFALHGITAQHRAFNSSARLLEPSADGMVALDLRGRGDSGKPSSGSYGLARHSEDVVRALDSLGVERGLLVGHSMGAFVALHTALSYPERVAALVLLDGGWPRPEEEVEEESAAIEEGLARAFRRLDMVFETTEDYLDFWFPGQGLTFKDLPPDLADYYRYDLGEVEGGYQPKASREAAEEDAESVSSESPTAAEMRDIRCPVALVRAAEGFFPDSKPLISDETRDVMAEALDLRSETLLPGANHYSMLFEPFAGRWVGLLSSDWWRG